MQSITIDTKTNIKTIQCYITNNICTVVGNFMLSINSNVRIRNHTLVLNNGFGLQKRFFQNKLISYSLFIKVHI